MWRAALPLLLGLASCGELSGNSPHDFVKAMTPGVTIECAESCSVSFGNVDEAPVPGERAVPDHEPLVAP